MRWPSGKGKTEMEVPLLDMRAQYAELREEISAAVLSVLESQRCVGGPLVEELESKIAEYSGCAAGVGVSSGTDALLCSLMALEIGPGDEVVTTPYTFFGTAGSIWRAGAKPVFVDIEPDTFNIDPSKIAAAVTEKTKAVMPVHLCGQMAEMDPILELADERGLYVIEDAAQAIGAAYKSRRAGSLGTAGCFSFYPSKNLGGIGDGGMIVTHDETLAARLRSLRNHGEHARYVHRWVGGNFRLDAVQAAALLVKFKYLDVWSAKRRANAARYDELFAGFDPVVTPAVREHNVSIFNLYLIRVPRRDALRAFLAEHGIATAIYYPLPLHQQECFRPLGGKPGDFPESERAAAESLALPVYPELTDPQIRHVAGKIREFLS